MKKWCKWDKHESNVSLLSDAYSEPIVPSMIELFAKEHLRWSFLGKQLTVVSYFRKNVHSRCSTGFWIHLRLLLLFHSHWTCFSLLMSKPRTSHQRFSEKKGVLGNLQENTCVRVSFLIKLLLYLKRNSSTGVFLWMLRNF